MHQKIKMVKPEPSQPSQTTIPTPNSILPDNKEVVVGTAFTSSTQVHWGAPGRVKLAACFGLVICMVVVGGYLMYHLVLSRSSATVATANQATSEDNNASAATDIVKKPPVPRKSDSETKKSTSKSSTSSSPMQDSGGGSTPSTSGSGGGATGSTGSDGGGTAPPPSTSWPNATNTGVPAGTTLIPSGTIVVNAAGTIINAMDVTGCIDVNAPNVTIKNTRVRNVVGSGGCSGNVILSESTGLVIENTEIDGQSDADVEGLGWSDYTCLRCKIHGVGDGARINGNILIQDSYIYGLVEVAGSHNDGVQVTEGSNIVIRHNAIENPNGQTSAVMIGADQGSVDHVTIDNNLLNGGGYTLYGGGSPPSGNTISYIQITNNHFGKKFYSTCGYYGPTSAINTSAPGNTYSDNVWDDTGQLVSG